MEYKITPESTDNIESITIERIAWNRPIIKLKNNHTSLGPFVRITQGEKERRHVYVLAYFNEEVKEFRIADGFPTLTISAVTESNIKNKQQDLLCFIIRLKKQVGKHQEIDIEIDFNGKKSKGDVGEPTRGTVATPAIK